MLHTTFPNASVVAVLLALEVADDEPVELRVELADRDCVEVTLELAVVEAVVLALDDTDILTVVVADELTDEVTVDECVVTSQFKNVPAANCSAALFSAATVALQWS